jgi:hypothetical protein
MDSSLDNMSKKELLEQINRLEKKNNEIEKEKFEIQQDKNYLQQQTSVLEHKTTALEQKLSAVQFHYEQLKRLVFGTKRERFIASANPFQQTLPFEELENDKQEESKTVKQTVTYERKKKRENHHGRIPLPSHLPVKEIVLEPKVDTTGMVCIGKEITDQLELIPSRLFIQRFIRPKYVLKKEKQEELIKKGDET